jgi:hypothetical protein
MIELVVSVVFHSIPIGCEAVKIDEPFWQNERPSLLLKIGAAGKGLTRTSTGAELSETQPKASVSCAKKVPDCAVVTALVTAPFDQR